MIRILSLLIFVFGFQNYYSQDEYHLIDIENDTVFEDMKLLDTIDDSYRLFFSGENHAFQISNLKLELKLLKYFHMKHNVNTLLLEFGGATGWMANEYLKTGNKELEKSIETHFSENFYSYFKGVKKYNDSLPEDKKLKIVGIDLQRSYSIAFEMLNYMLPGDSIYPHDSILTQIEMVKFLQGYNSNRITNLKQSEYYYSRQRYNNHNSMKILIDNFNKFESLYEAYLGDNFETFKEFMSYSKDSYQYYEKNRTGTPIGILFREQYMYNNLNQMAINSPNDKYYGQFGRNHTIKNVNSNGYTFNFSSMVAKIEKNTDCALHKNVLPIGIYYLENEKVWRNSYYQYDDEKTEFIKEYLSKFPKDSIALVEIEKNSEIDSALDLNYQYIIVHNGQYKNEIKRNNYEDYYETETITFNMIYGQYIADLAGTYNYLGLTGNVQPISYWGLTYSNLYDGFYFDYQFLSFIKSKHSISDTSNAEFRGYNISMNIGYDVLKTRRLDLIPMIGFGYQQTNLKITTENIPSNFSGINSAEFNLRNPAIYFDFSGEFRVMIVKEFLGLSLKSGYRLDVSNSRWKYGKSKLDDAQFNQSGLFFQAGICLGSF